VPDLRTILRALRTDHAVRNARAEIQEQTRVHEEIDALARRIAPVMLPAERLVS
jgi:hypothetical protein